ncbi:MAG TPA: AMP-binding protein [Trebonia sp.]|nr:AMP-binding protein [Trebonia sp.]
MHAVLLRDTVADAEQLAGPLAKALDGTGPAILPLDAALPAPRLRQLTDAIAPGAGVAEDTAVVIATSGSTGEPKGVELSAAALCHSARASLARLGPAPPAPAAAGGGAGGWLCCLPVTHVAGLQVLVRSLLSSSERTVAPTLTATALSESGCSYVSVVPTQLVRLLDEPGGAAALAEFAAVLVGGAAAAAGLLDRARAAGVRVVTTYGMSETCGGCVYDGVPLDGVTVRAAGDELLRISGPVLMNRYRGGPDLGDEFVTADLGYVRDGRVVVRGRADDVINTGGHKVVPGEVAAVLESCPGVLEVIVVGRADPEWGQRVTAVVVPADPADPPSLELLRTHVSERLPRYACPSEVVLTRAIPLLASGKPDLASLKAAGTLRGREQSPALSVN